MRFSVPARRGLGDPLLVVIRGRAGNHPGDQECVPRSARQRCRAPRMRNLAAEVPTDLGRSSRLAAALSQYSRLGQASSAVLQQNPSFRLEIIVIYLRRSIML